MSRFIVECKIDGEREIKRETERETETETETESETETETETETELMYGVSVSWKLRS